jgi:uncharacterized protein YneF (UPF0154 family)
MALLLVMVTLVAGLQLGGYVVLRKLASDNN